MGTGVSTSKGKGYDRRRSTDVRPSTPDLIVGDSFHGHSMSTLNVHDRHLWQPLDAERDAAVAALRARARFECPNEFTNDTGDYSPDDSFKTDNSDMVIPTPGTPKLAEDEPPPPPPAPTLPLTVAELSRIREPLLHRVRRISRELLNLSPPSSPQRRPSHSFTDVNYRGDEASPSLRASLNRMSTLGRSTNARACPSPVPSEPS